MNRDRLIEDLPPLAPVASEEDTSCDEAVCNDAVTSPTSKQSNAQLPPIAPPRKSTKSPLNSRTHKQNSEHNEYAIDFTTPPLFPRLTHVTKQRPARMQGLRRPSRIFLHTLLGRGTSAQT
jgi:hypothetical protein